jgi:hypothetical protein
VTNIRNTKLVLKKVKNALLSAKDASFISQLSSCGNRMAVLPMGMGTHGYPN